MRLAATPDVQVVEWADLAAEAACFCCETHLEEWWGHERWSDDGNRWLPFCAGPRHHKHVHLTQGADGYHYTLIGGTRHSSPWLKPGVYSREN